MIAFEVKDMTCGHCVSNITKALKATDKDAKVLIDLATHRVQVGGHQGRWLQAGAGRGGAQRSCRGRAWVLLWALQVAAAGAVLEPGHGGMMLASEQTAMCFGPNFKLPVGARSRAYRI